MDRRQKKTRRAIFEAFSRLLAQKRFGKITVQEIIDEANVGRATFYAHFETRDELLGALCEDLFSHIMSSADECAHIHGLYSSASAETSVFCHLLHHLRENDKHILDLLSCESHDLFLRYFKDHLRALIRRQFLEPGRPLRQDLPEDFLINHISGSFVEMVLWWIQGRMKQSPAELDRYFRSVIEVIFRRDDEPSHSERREAFSEEGEETAPIFREKSV